MPCAPPAPAQAEWQATLNFATLLAWRPPAPPAAGIEAAILDLGPAYPAIRRKRADFRNEKSGLADLLQVSKKRMSFFFLDPQVRKSSRPCSFVAVVAGTSRYKSNHRREGRLADLRRCESSSRADWVAWQTHSSALDGAASSERRPLRHLRALLWMAPPLRAPALFASLRNLRASAPPALLASLRNLRASAPPALFASLRNLRASAPPALFASPRNLRASAPPALFASLRNLRASGPPALFASPRNLRASAPKLCSRARGTSARQPRSIGGARWLWRIGGGPESPAASPQGSKCKSAGRGAGQKGQPPGKQVRKRSLRPVSPQALGAGHKACSQPSPRASPHQATRRTLSERWLSSIGGRARRPQSQPPGKQARALSPSLGGPRPPPHTGSVSGGDKARQLHAPHPHTCQGATPVEGGGEN